MFAVGELILEDLVAAEPVAPDVGGDVAPVGAVVAVDVVSGLGEDESRVAQGVTFRIARGRMRKDEGRAFRGGRHAQSPYLGWV